MLASALSDQPGLPYRLVETSFAALPGFAEDDHREAWQVFRRSAEAIAHGQPALRPAVPYPESLIELCRWAIDRPCSGSGSEARRFFEASFKPHRILPLGTSDGAGFLTGFYEPEVDGSRSQSDDFTAPVLARPPDLGRIGPGIAEHPYLDRAAIEARIGSSGFKPVVWLRDWVEVFFIQVQGSGRVRLPDGTFLRLVYDGRNGQPYTSIGRQLVESGAIRREDMSLDRLKGWLRREGLDVGQPGRDLMQANRSYIFFRAEVDGTRHGPVGGAGVPLSRLRSIAVDRTLWPYGLPFFVDAVLPWQDAEPRPFQRLTVAQDTGSAIIGPARADLFFGTGDDAGRRAGGIRHPATLTVLLPRLPPEVQ